jgi:predicted nucleic acid-binding protein
MTRHTRMSSDLPRQGLLDTNILILRRWIDPAGLPDEMAISAITLAELSAGPHEVRSNNEQNLYDEHAERARRLEILQRAESEFDAVPFDAEAARIYGRVTAAVIAVGRKPRRRTADLMIAATAIAEELPLFTTNPADFVGLDALMRIIPVTRPAVPREQPRGRLRRPRQWHQARPHARPSRPAQDGNVAGGRNERTACTPGRHLATS